MVVLPFGPKGSRILMVVGLWRPELDGEAGSDCLCPRKPNVLFS